MDSAISTAARALTVGDALSALKLVALRSDPPALALRGIALAQLGELRDALGLLRRAAKAFGAAEPVSRARCVVAEAEVALSLRDLSGAEEPLEDAVRLLLERGDVTNALCGRLVQARRMVLLGQVQDAERLLSVLAETPAPPRFSAICGLIAADVAMKLVRPQAAERALERAQRAAGAARIASLTREVELGRQRFEAPVARLSRGGKESSVRLVELEQLLASGDLIVDGCRREVRLGKVTVPLVTRPILLELLLPLAEQAPNEVPRADLIARAFGARRPNESHRARLRVELGRLRRLLVGLASVSATASGFALEPSGGRRVSVLLPPNAGETSELLALLRGGEAWGTAGLAAALAKSQRAVQRALVELEAAGKVRSLGRGRAQRWVAVPGDYATSLLLVAPGTLG